MNVPPLGREVALMHPILPEFFPPIPRRDLHVGVSPWYISHRHVPVIATTWGINSRGADVHLMDNPSVASAASRYGPQMRALAAVGLEVLIDIQVSMIFVAGFRLQPISATANCGIPGQLDALAVDPHHILNPLAGSLREDQPHAGLVFLGSPVRQHPWSARPPHYPAGVDHFSSDGVPGNIGVLPTLLHRANQLGPASS